MRSFLVALCLYFLNVMGISEAAEIRGIGGKCLDAAGFSSADGTPVILWSCHGGENQQWAVHPNGLITGIGGKCLDAEGFSSADGTRIILWSCHGGDNQRWEITNNREILGTGNKCLDATGFSSADGTPVILWSCHGGENQKWNARYEQAQSDGGICSNACTASTGGCVAYEHADFDGDRQDLGPNQIFTYVGDGINDEISSFRVSCGCRVTAWEHRDRGGASRGFDECQYVGDSWNDTISSWQCTCR